MSGSSHLTVAEPNVFADEWRRRESNPRDVPILSYHPSGYQNARQHAGRHALVAALRERDGYSCFYCGIVDGKTVDHVRPRPEGSDLFDNLVLACSACNLRKSRMAAWFFLIWRWGKLGLPPAEQTDGLPRRPE